MDLKALEDQAKAQGGYVDKVSKTPWKSSPVENKYVVLLGWLED